MGSNDHLKHYLYSVGDNATYLQLNKECSRNNKKAGVLNGRRSGKSEDLVLFEPSDVLEEAPYIRCLPLGFFFSNLNSTIFFSSWIISTIKKHVVRSVYFSYS